MKIVLYLVMFSLVLLSGCAPKNASSGDYAAAVSRDDLIKRTFVLVRVDGEKALPQEGRPPTLAFDDNFRLSGSLCNVFSGSAVLTDNVLTVEQMLSTMMSCLDGNLSDVEALFFSMLHSGVTLSLKADALVLEQGGHRFEYTAVTP